MEDDITLIVSMRCHRKGYALRILVRHLGIVSRSIICIQMVAELSNLHRNYIGGVELGERNIGLLNIVQLAHALRVKVTALVELIPCVCDRCCPLEICPRPVT